MLFDNRTNGEHSIHRLKDSKT